MATITEKKRNGKVVAFKFFHCVGRDEKGKQHFRTTTWKPPENLSYAKAKKMAELVHVDTMLNRKPGQLSGGQQQRVAIARALAVDPEIIYFDEPTSALDPELIGEVLNVMRDLANEGMTMLVVTHEMNFARNVSSKVIFMENGKVIESADSKSFFENPKEERTRSFIQSIMSARD